MAIKIDLSDGNTAEFPDGTSKDEIKMALDKKFGTSGSHNAETAPKNPSTIKEFLSGLAQGTGNFPVELGNLGIEGINKISNSNIPHIPRFNFAPNTVPARVGDLASMFVGPSGLGKLALRGAEHIPAFYKALKASNSLLEKAPLASSIGKNALIGAAYSPDDRQTGALLGGTAPLFGKALGAFSPLSSPVSNALLRAVIGGGIGAAGASSLGYSPVTGGLLGAGAGVSAPGNIKNILGSAHEAGLSPLETLSEDKIRKPFDSAARLQTPITPAEATGNTYLAGIEGRYGRKGEAAQQKAEIFQDREQKQKNAILKLFDTIHEETPQSNQRINQLYTDLQPYNLKPDIINKIKENPVLNEAFEKIRKNPQYEAEYKIDKKLPENNILYLNLVKQRLDDKYNELTREGAGNEARIVQKNRNKFVNFLDSQVPGYRLAREESQKQIIRRELEQGMASKKLRGSDFFKKYLENDTNLEELLGNLKNVPEAQSQLRDMKTAWHSLVNADTVRSSAGRAETSLDQSRNDINRIMDIWADLQGQKYNKAALEFIHGGKWDKGFEKIQQIKDKKLRTHELLKFMGKIPSFGAVEFMKDGDNNDNFL